MSKDNKNEMTKDPEDQRTEFPRGTSASAGLDPRPIEQVGRDADPNDPSQPTRAAAGAESQGRRPQEGASEQTSTGKKADLTRGQKAVKK